MLVNAFRGHRIINMIGLMGFASQILFLTFWSERKRAGDAGIKVADDNWVLLVHTSALYFGVMRAVCAVMMLFDGAAQTLYMLDYSMKGKPCFLTAVLFGFVMLYAMRMKMVWIYDYDVADQLLTAFTKDQALTALYIWGTIVFVFLTLIFSIFGD